VKPSTRKKARSLGFSDLLYLDVTNDDKATNTCDLDAAYVASDLVKPSEKKVIGVYELVRLETIEGSVATVHKEFK
jgi:hypothetical protein